MRLPGGVAAMVLHPGQVPEWEAAVGEELT